MLSLASKLGTYHGEMERYAGMELSKGVLSVKRSIRGGEITIAMRCGLA